MSQETNPEEDCPSKTNPDITYSDDKRTISIDLDKGDWIFFAIAILAIVFGVTQVV